MAGRVYIHVRGKITPDLVRTIRASGGTITGVYAKTGDLHAWLGLGWVEQLAQRPEVRSIKSAKLPKTLKGTFITEGDVTHGSAFIREQYGAAGAGRTVGVVSDSDDFLSNSQATFDLPQTVTTIFSPTGLSGEGTAMMEIIHDLAPETGLVFGSGALSPEQMADVINEMVNNYGVNYLVTDIVYDATNVFQISPMEKAMDDAVNGGTEVFAAVPETETIASVWKGDFTDGGSFTYSLPDGSFTFTGNIHRFPNSSINNRATGNGFARLFWSDPMGASENDYDLITTDLANNVIAASTNFQGGFEDPVEYLGVNAGESLRIIKSFGEDRALHLRLEGGQGALQQQSEQGSLAPYGAVGPSAYMIGATSALASFPFNFSAFSNLVASSSTMSGSRDVFLNPDGTTIVPNTAPLYANNSYITYDLKVDGVAATNVNTSVPGFQPFGGTSAAVSHAAAIAAQISSLDRVTTTATSESYVFGPLLSREELRQTLLGTAQDIHTPGVDARSGAGILKADRAADSLVNFIKGFQVVGIKQTEATFNWFTNLPSGGEIYLFSVENPDENYYWFNFGGEQVYSVPFQGLTPNTQYIYLARSTSSSGAADQIIGGTFKTLPVNEVEVRVSGAVLLSRFQSPWRCQITVLNEGGTPASNVKIETAVLSASSTLTRLPLTLPTIGAGSSQTATLLFGRQKLFPNMKVRVSGSYTTTTGATKRFSNEVDLTILP